MFVALLPYYLSIGMTPNEFWHGDTALHKAYREAQKLKDKKRNQDLWLQGLYVYEAIIDASPILRFTTKRDVKPLPYPDEPYPITPEERREREERIEREKYEAMQKRIFEWAEAVSKRFAEKKNEADESNQGESLQAEPPKAESEVSEENNSNKGETDS